MHALAASACTILPPAPPPPGVSAETYARKLAAEDQASLWNNRSTVIIARVVSVTTRPDGTGRYPTAVRVRPAKTLEGAPVARDFSIRPALSGMCPAMGARDMFASRPGDVFVLFVTRGRPADGRAIASIRLDKVLDPRIKAAIDRGR